MTIPMPPLSSQIILNWNKQGGPGGRSATTEQVTLHKEIKKADLFMLLTSVYVASQS